MTTDDYRHQAARTMSEDALQTQVINMAQQLGWRCLHIRPARTEDGWRTPIQADGKGWPDLLLVRGADIIACELKSERGTVRPEQQAWLDALEAAGAYAVVWRPSHLVSGVVAATLSGGHR